jgi:PEP-CTERM motif
MSSKNFMIRPLAAAALLLAVGSSQAALTVYTSAAAFGSAISSPGVDTYTGLSITGPTNSPITRTAGAYTYTAAASTSSFFGAGTTANPWLSTNLASDSITFSGFSPSVQGLGGLFYGSDIAGNFLAGDVTLTATDSLGASVTQVISPASITSFLGFVSTGNLVSVTLASVPLASGAAIWPTADNLTLGVVTTGVIPEPGTYAMLLAGLGFVGFMARRRKD